MGFVVRVYLMEISIRSCCSTSCHSDVKDQGIAVVAVIVIISLVSAIRRIEGRVIVILVKVVMI